MMHFFWLTLSFYLGVKTLQPSKIPVIIDADTANEVDDLFALIRALKSDKLDILGITSAQFHISPLATDSTVRESQILNEQIVELLDRSDIELPIGSNHPMKSTRQPASSDASEFIIKQARKYTPDDPLQIVILGSCTNVASAIVEDPSIIPNIRVNYLGFWHDPISNNYNKKEFNSGNDTIAVNYLLNQPNLDLVVMSATTSQHLVFKKTTLEESRESQPILAAYLLNRWNAYQRWWTTEDPEKTQWIMWDVAIIEALIHPEWTRKEVFKTPPENTLRNIEIYTWIDKESMTRDFWEVFRGQ